MKKDKTPEILRYYGTFKDIVRIKTCFKVSLLRVLHHIDVSSHLELIAVIMIPNNEGWYVFYRNNEPKVRLRHNISL